MAAYGGKLLAVWIRAEFSGKEELQFSAERAVIGTQDALERKARQVKARELETARLRALQERAQDQRSEMDELRARRCLMKSRRSHLSDIFLCVFIFFEAQLDRRAGLDIRRALPKCGLCQAASISVLSDSSNEHGLDKACLVSVKPSAFDARLAAQMAGGCCEERARSGEKHTAEGCRAAEGAG